MLHRFAAACCVSRLTRSCYCFAVGVPTAGGGGGLLGGLGSSVTNLLGGTPTPSGGGGLPVSCQSDRTRVSSVVRLATPTALVSAAARKPAAAQVHLLELPFVCP